MPEKKKDTKKEGSPDLPAQPEEVRRQTLERAAHGRNTATGQAFEELAGERKEPEDRGSTTPIAGGDSITADFPEHEKGEPVGLQAEPAAFTVNGSLPAGQVPSPGGPIPVGLVSKDAKDAAARTEETYEEYGKGLRSTAPYKQITEQQVTSMSAAELRAVAHDRGYDIGDYAGTHRTRARFLKAQSDDEILQESAATEEAETGGSAGGDNPPPPGT